MIETWSIEKLQRLCELAKAEAAKKDKTLKRPGKEAGVDEKYAYLEKIHYTKLLKEDILVRALERLEKLCKSGSDAQNKYGEDLELLREGIRTLQNGGMGVGSAELNEFRNEAATNLNALQAGYPEKTGKELLVILGNDRNQERYFYILHPAEMMKGESSELFSREYIDNIRNLYLKEKTNYEKVVEELENCIKEEKGRSASLNSESEFALFLNAFKAYEEVEQGKQKLNKENCSEFLHEMENRLLKPIQEAESGSGLKQAMILAFRYPECLERFCVIRNLEELNKAVEYKKEITEQLTAQMIQQSPGLTRKMIAQIAAGLNIKLAETGTEDERREKSENQYRPEPKVSSENLALVHTYIMKEMPKYIQGVKPYYNALQRMVKKGTSHDYVDNLKELRSIQDNFWNNYNRWIGHRKLMADINLDDSEEAMRQIAEGDRQMQGMAEAVKKNGQMLEVTFSDFLAQKYKILKEYRERYNDLASQSAKLLNTLEVKRYVLGRKEKKKIERELDGCRGKLNQLEDEILKESYRWKDEGSKSDTVRKQLEDVRNGVRAEKEQAEEVLNKIKRRRTRIKVIIGTPLTLFLCFCICVIYYGYQDNKTHLPTDEEVAKYNELMDNPTLETLAPYFPSSIDITRVSDLHLDDPKDIFKKGVELTSPEEEVRNFSWIDRWNLFYWKIYGKAITFNYEVNGIKYQITTIMDLYKWVHLYERPEKKGKKPSSSGIFSETSDKVFEYGTFEGRVLKGRYVLFEKEQRIESYKPYPISFVFGNTNDGINYDGCYVIWNNEETVPCTDVKIEKAENVEKKLMGGIFVPEATIDGEELKLYFTTGDPSKDLKEEKKFELGFNSVTGKLYHEGYEADEKLTSRFSLGFVQ